MEEQLVTNAETASANASPKRARRTARPTDSKAPARATKSATIAKLLSRPRGAGIDELMKATGWQAHSVRGFIAGTLKKRAGKDVVSEATDKGRIYRLVDTAA